MKILGLTLLDLGVLKRLELAAANKEIYNNKNILKTAEATFKMHDLKINLKQNTVNSSSRHIEIVDLNKGN